MDSQALSPPNSRGKLICGAAQREFTPVKKLPHQIKRQRAEHEVPALLSCTSSHSDITTMPEHCIMPRLSPPPKKTPISICLIISYKLLTALIKLNEVYP